MRPEAMSASAARRSIACVCVMFCSEGHRGVDVQTLVGVRGGGDSATPVDSGSTAHAHRGERAQSSGNWEGHSGDCVGSAPTLRPRARTVQLSCCNLCCRLLHAASLLIARFANHACSSLRHPSLSDVRATDAGAGGDEEWQICSERSLESMLQRSMQRAHTLIRL